MFQKYGWHPYFILNIRLNLQYCHENINGKKIVSVQAHKFRETLNIRQK